MNCRESRRHLQERALNPALPRSTPLELERHVSACDACAAFEREEQQLSHALRLLREPLPLSVDVAERTRLAVARLGRVSRRETDTRALAWATTLAAAASVVVGFAFMLNLPQIIRDFKLTDSRAVWLTDRARPVLRVVGSVKDAGLDVLRDLGRATLPLLASIESPARLTLAAAYLVIAAVILFVLSREWRPTPASPMETNS